MFDLGVSHGIVGIIGFLAGALMYGVEPKLTKPLLQESLRWLMAQDQDPHFKYTCSIHTPSDRSTAQGRLAWCYGDLGNSVVLLNAARILGNKKLEKAAIKVAVRALDFELTDAGVEEPTLCHGSFGAFHIFNRLFQMTGDTRFKDRALFWMEDGFRYLELYRKNPQLFTVTFNEMDLHYGKVGIALSLLAGLSKAAPEWDSLLLVSYPKL